MNRPKVGVGVLIINEGKILLGKRKNAHGDGLWAPPGGHLEFGESLEGCARREVLEETGLEVLSIKKLGFTNDIFVQEGKHYITIFMITHEFIGSPRALEPDKCEYWQWFDVNNLPDNLFLPLQNLLKEESLVQNLISKNID